MNRDRYLATAFCLVSFCLAGAAELLHFDFNDSAHLGAQTGNLPAGTVMGPVAPSGETGAADFSGGLVKLPGFPGPQGPFSIEARFRLRHYGPESSRFIADILNTATWDTGPAQGFAFRVGGSYLYPVLPRNRYATEQEWQNAQDAYSHIDRGRLSVCFADFVIARQDDNANWKQALTDRCIETGAWTHMAAVWDGTDMRIYLNGLDATDTLRLDGAGKPTRVDSVETAYVGSRIEGEYDPRHFDGEIDYVKVEDKALSPTEIHARYQATFVPEKRDSLCWGVLLPLYPEAGKVCPGRLHIETKVFNHGACTDPKIIAGFLAGDSVEIEVAKNADFDTIAARLRFADLSFDLDLGSFSALAGYRGPIYWRVRLIPAKRANALAKAAAAEPEWSPSRPIVLDLSGTTDLALPAPGLARAPRLVRAMAGLLLQGPEEPVLFDLSGKRVAVRFRRLPQGEGNATYWRLESVPAGAGVLLAR